MEKILYRAKRKSDLEWVYGYYAKVRDYLSYEYIHIIFPLGTTRYPHGEFDEHEEIIPETLECLIGNTWADCYTCNFEEEVYAHR